MRTVTLLAMLASACGTTSVCGNGKVESGEQCDDGNLEDGDGCSSTCRATPTIDTFVHWSLVAVQYDGFNETCDGVGATDVQLDFTGPKSFSVTQPCANFQTKFSTLPHGDYVVKGTLLDSTGAALTRGQAELDFTQGGDDLNVTIDFPYEDFTTVYTGNFYFKVTWAGVDTCAAAGVVKETVKLERNGAVVAGVTDNGIPLDGSATGMCEDADQAASQFATGVIWGPATLTVVGEDATGKALYRGSIDTFTGAGVSNPSVMIDVPSTATPDAGVGADAAPADARPGDAG